MCGVAATSRAGAGGSARLISRVSRRVVQQLVTLAITFRRLGQESNMVHGAPAADRADAECSARLCQEVRILRSCSSWPSEPRGSLALLYPSNQVRGAATFHPGSKQVHDATAAGYHTAVVAICHTAGAESCSAPHWLVYYKAHSSLGLPDAAMHSAVGC